MVTCADEYRLVIGILGGTFDPVHYGHLRLAEEALDALGLAQVHFIPAGLPPHRAAPQLAALNRLDMVRLAIADNPRFVLDDREIRKTAPCYSVETLLDLRAERGPDVPLYLITGADAFLGLHTWHRWRELFDLAHIAVAERPGHTLGAALTTPELAREMAVRQCEVAALSGRAAGGIVRFDMTPLAISATRIRALLAEGKSPRYLLPDVILDYIHTEKPVHHDH